MSAFPACILSVLLMAALASRACGAEAVPAAMRIEVARDAGVSVDIENLPLNETLRRMAQKGLFEIRGAVPPGEAVTVHFSHLTLDEALKKLMRGYNYVLVDQGASRAPLLMLMGKIEGVGPPQRAAASPGPSRPLAAVPEPEPGAPPVSPRGAPAPDQQPPAGTPAPPQEMSPPGLPQPAARMGAPAAQAGPVPPPGQTGETGGGQGGGAPGRPEGGPEGKGQPQEAPGQPQAAPETSPGFSF